MGETKALTARDVMSVPVLSVPAKAPLDGIVRIMRNHAIGALPVTDQSGRPLGIITQTDVSASEERQQGAEQHTAAALMSGPLHTVDVATPVPVIAELFAARQIKHVLVLSGGALVGIVSATDLEDRVPRRVGFESDERLRKRIIANLRAAESSLAELPDFSISEGVVHFWGRLPTAAELDAIVTAANAAPLQQ
jgi:CBS domain-containing protein